MKTEWISVKDDLPKHKKPKDIHRVVCYLEINNTKEVIIAALTPDEDGALWWMENRDEGFPFNTVTHWMLLPPPPTTK